MKRPFNLPGNLGGHQNNDLKWLFQCARPFIKQLILLVGIDTAVSLVGVAIALVSKWILDTAEAMENLQQLVKPMVLMIVITALTLAVEFVSSIVSTLIREKFAFHIRQKLFRQVICSEWLQVSRYHSGDIQTRLTSDVTAIANGIVEVAPYTVSLLVKFAVSFITLFYFNALLSVFIAVLAPLAVISSKLVSRKLKSIQEKVQESEAAYRSFMQETVSNIIVVKTFNYEERGSERLLELHNSRMHWIMKRTRVSVLASTLLGIGNTIGFSISFVWGAVLVSLGTITFGTMTVFLQLASQVQQPVMQLAAALPKIIQLFASAGRIRELEKLDMEERGPIGELSEKSLALELKNLNFGYPDKKPVLSNAGLKIENGEIVAIVGPSGTGKTTLIRLILRLIQSSKGSLVFYDQQDHAISDSVEIRKYIAYVPQGNSLFSGTIEDNLKMGKQDATEEEMLRALKLAEAYNFTMDLPHQINTVVGEKAYGLSEGQAQRLAIARAFIRNSPILIFDEATSSLDKETELRIMNTLRNLHPRPTCIMITHRKSVLNYCDRVIGVEDGKLVEISAAYNGQSVKG